MHEARLDPTPSPDDGPSRRTAAVARVASMLAPILGAIWLMLGGGEPIPVESDSVTAAAIARWAGAATCAVAAGALVATLVLNGLQQGTRTGISRRASACLLLALPLMIVVVTLLGGGEWFGQLPSPTGAAVSLAALVVLGLGLGTPRLPHGLARAAALALVALLLDGAASGWGVLGPVPPWSPEVAAVLLDLSPRALVLETGGVDWMRHPSVYEAVGTDRIGPGIRTGWAGSVAASVPLVVGCVAVGLGFLRSAGRGRA